MRTLAKLLPGTRPDSIVFDFKVRDDAWWFELRQRIGLPVAYVHEVHLPDGYASDPAHRWPLILFLHGSGERGDDITRQRKLHPAGNCQGAENPCHCFMAA